MAPAQLLAELRRGGRLAAIKRSGMTYLKRAGAHNYEYIGRCRLLIDESCTGTRPQPLSKEDKEKMRVMFRCTPTKTTKPPRVKPSIPPVDLWLLLHRGSKLLVNDRTGETFIRDIHWQRYQRVGCCRLFLRKPEECRGLHVANGQERRDFSRMLSRQLPATKVPTATLTSSHHVNVTLQLERLHAVLPYNLKWILTTCKALLLERPPLLPLMQQLQEVRIPNPIVVQYFRCLVSFVTGSDTMFEKKRASPKYAEYIVVRMSNPDGSQTHVRMPRGVAQVSVVLMAALATARGMELGEGTVLSEMAKHCSSVGWLSSLQLRSRN